MSNLTASTTGFIYKKLHSQVYSGKVANAIRLYAGGFAGFPGSNALTSYRGYLCKWQDQVNIQWAGIVEPQSWTGALITSAQTGTASNVNSILGDTSATPVPEVTVEQGPCILSTVTVTGVSAQSDVYRTLVYCTTDNYGDMRTTATSYAPAIGKVSYWYSSTTCDVMIFGLLRTIAVS